MPEPETKPTAHDAQQRTRLSALCCDPSRITLRALSRVHLIGVGGTGMSSLAGYLVGCGCRLTGSDMSNSEAVERVRAAGVPVGVGHSAANLPAELDVVVCTAAVPSENPEVREAQRRGLPVLKYAQMAGLIMRNHRSVAVAGTHGKTTTSSMVSFILLRAGLEPSFLIGGNVRQLGGPQGLGGSFGRGNWLVAEACEYDRSFWNFEPDVAVITNVDRDHLDYFRSDADLLDAFTGFARRVRPGGLLVANADDQRSRDALLHVEGRRVTFGAGLPAGRAGSPDCSQGGGADWRFDPSQVQRRGGRTAFRAQLGGRDVGEFQLIVPGRHNVCNALAAAAACSEAGVDLEVIRRALAEFGGAERRLQRLGEAAGVTVMDDYAHHPAEVKATLAALREDHPLQRLWCVFQPHQYSRTRLLLECFASAFAGADRVVVLDIYSARDSRADMDAVSSALLVERLREKGTEAEHIANYEAVVQYLAGRVKPDDVVVTMGAGPVHRAAGMLLRRLTPEAVPVPRHEHERAKVTADADLSR